MDYSSMTDAQCDALYDYYCNQLRSLNPGALKRIQKRLDACQNVGDRLKLLDKVIKDETRELKSLRDSYADQLKTQYPDAYADIEDMLEGDDYITQIETLKDTIANEESQRSREVQPQPQPIQHTPIVFNDIETPTHMSQRQPKSAIPDWDDSLQSLKAMREGHIQVLKENDIPTHDFNKVLEKSAFFKRNMPTNLVKKSKQNKYGLNQAAMTDLINIVTKMKQDIKKIKDTQSVASANKWISRHNYEGL